jgi:hypothetical protein
MFIRAEAPMTSLLAWWRTRNDGLTAITVTSVAGQRKDQAPNCAIKKNGYLRVEDCDNEGLAEIVQH